MPDTKPTVDIEHSQVYSLATVLGVMTRAFEEWDSSLFDPKHEIAVPALLVCVFLLDRNLDGDLFQAALATFFEVGAKRKILSESPKEVAWPEWDPSMLKHPENIPLYDLGIILAAWNLAAKQDELPPEMFLGPLFTLAGVIVEGVDHGYFLEDKNVRKIYEEQRVKLSSTHGGEEGFKTALKAQLQSINDSLNDAKSSHKPN